MELVLALLSCFMLHATRLSLNNLRAAIAVAAEVRAWFQLCVAWSLGQLPIGHILSFSSSGRLRSRTDRYGQI